VLKSGRVETRWQADGSRAEFSGIAIAGWQSEPRHAVRPFVENDCGFQIGRRERYIAQCRDARLISRGGHEQLRACRREHASLSAAGGLWQIQR